MKLIPLSDRVIVKQVDAEETTKAGIILTNPPYGDRMLDAAQAEALYKGIGRAWRGAKDWRCYVLTSSLDFEKSFGRRASKRRKLYNGSIPCQLYMYF